MGIHLLPQAAAPESEKLPPAFQPLSVLFCGNCACIVDDGYSVFGSDEVKELLRGIGKFCILFGYKHERALNFVAAVLNRCFCGCNAVNGESFHGVFKGGQGGIADCIGV